MNKSELIARMTERLGGDRTSAATAVNGVLEEIENSVARGERVSLSGFGTFDRRERAPRTGRNPRTGEAIQVGASVAPVFRAGIGFKTLLIHSDGASEAPPSAAAHGEIRKAEGRTSPATVSASPAESVVLAADASADGGKKKAKKAAKQGGKKDTKKARKAAKSKAGTKA